MTLFASSDETLSLRGLCRLAIAYGGHRAPGRAAAAPHLIRRTLPSSARTHAASLDATAFDLGRLTPDSTYNSVAHLLATDT